MFASIKTTLAGLILVGVGVYALGFTQIDKVIGGAIITAGLGLIASKDSNVTGGTKEQ